MLMYADGFMIVGQAPHVLSLNYTVKTVDESFFVMQVLEKTRQVPSLILTRFVIKCVNRRRVRSTR